MQYNVAFTHKQTTMGRDCEDLSHLPKYRNRNTPAANANRGGCRGIVTVGNDGQLYESVNRSNNVHTWRLLCSKSRPCFAEPYLLYDSVLDDYSDDLVYLSRQGDGLRLTSEPSVPWWSLLRS